MNYALIKDGVVVNKIVAGPEFIEKISKDYDKVIVCEDCEFDVNQFFVEDKLIKRDLMDAHKKHMRHCCVEYYVCVEDNKPAIYEVYAGERPSGGIKLPPGWTKGDEDLIKIEDGKPVLDHEQKFKRADKDVEKIRKEVESAEWNEKPIMTRLKDSYFGSNS